MTPFYTWSRLLIHIPRQLNISNQSQKLYWFIVLQKDSSVSFQLCPWGPSWAPAVLGSGALLSRQKTQWPTLLDAPKQPLRTASKTKPLTEIRRMNPWHRQVPSLIQISHMEKWQDPRLLPNTPLVTLSRSEISLWNQGNAPFGEETQGDRNIKHSHKAGSSHLNTINPLLLLLPLFS